MANKLCTCSCCFSLLKLNFSVRFGWKTFVLLALILCYILAWLFRFIATITTGLTKGTPNKIANLYLTSRRLQCASFFLFYVQFNYLFNILLEWSMRKASPSKFKSQTFQLHVTTILLRLYDEALGFLPWQACYAFSWWYTLLCSQSVYSHTQNWLGDHLFMYCCSQFFAQCT